MDMPKTVRNLSGGFGALARLFMTRSGPPLPLKSRKPNVYTRDGRSLVSVVRGQDADGAVRRAVALIGGLEPIDVRGRQVLVKPNCNSADPHPATTNPAVLGSVVRLLYEAGAAHVVVTDMSGPPWITTPSWLRQTGLWAAAESAGAEIVDLSNEEWVAVEPPAAKCLRRFRVARRILEAERLVPVPVIKTHRYGTYSMSLKLAMGVVHPRDRLRMHFSRRLEEMLAEINLAIRADLVILDGTRSMVAGGPYNGPVEETNLIIASGDRVAVDLVGLGVVKRAGRWARVTERPLWAQRQIAHAVRLGLGATSAAEIELLGEALASDDHEFEELLDALRGYLHSR